MGEPTPLADLMVNDRYWLGRARGILDQAIRRRDEAAARLAAGVGWLWTVYAGAALIGVALRGQTLPGWLVWVLVTPALLLVAAYGLATWAALPIAIAFDPRVVQEIQAVHVHASRVKQRRLRLAGLAAGLGALAVLVLQSQFGALSLVVASPGGGLMAAAPDRPAERQGWVGRSMPQQADQQPA